MTASEFLNIIAGCDSFLSSNAYVDTLVYAVADIPKDYEIRKSNAARLLHIYIRDVLGIEDISDPSILSMAYELKDIYDCRKCVNDIAQVYVRSLMTEENDIFVSQNIKMFGTGKILTLEEAIETRNRIENLRVN